MLAGVALAAEDYLLADLSVKADDKPSENVELQYGKLVWCGELAVKPTILDVAYTAVGKGLYELSVPPGGILERVRGVTDRQGV